MTYVTLNDQYVKSFIQEEKLQSLETRIKHVHEQLHGKTGAGNNYLGWLDLPYSYNRDEFEEVKACADRIRQDSDVLLVIGIGGSYLGARAAIELLTHSFQNEIPYEQRNVPKIVFIGQQLSSKYVQDVFDLLDGQDISLNVISKSGTTTESAIAFRIFKSYMEEKYGKEEASERIYVTTDKEKGALKKIATKEDYQTFVIPDDIGGRFSVLTAVGLLPISVSGISIDDIIQGAKFACRELATPNVSDNPSYYYAVLRNALYEEGKKIELLSSYEPHFHYFQEWWKQLFGESEGKDGKGLFPVAANFTTDLHSLGQYIQDGERHLFQTILRVEQPSANIEVKKDTDNDDGLNYLAGKTLHEINNKALEGALLAHTNGGVPNIVLQIPKINAFTFGYLVYFFQKACAISGYLLQVNPFDQPGVEAYKRNMFTLLGKPE